MGRRALRAPVALALLVAVALIVPLGVVEGQRASTGHAASVTPVRSLVFTPPSNGSWTQPGGNAAHDGLSALNGPANGSVGWSRFLGADEPPSPVVQGGDGRLWVAEGWILGFNPNGTSAEQFDPAGYGPFSHRLLPVFVSPAVEPYGDAVIMNGANVTAVQDQPGFVGSAWRMPLPIGKATGLGSLAADTPATVAPGGYVFVASSWGKLYALDPHGSLRWSVTLASLSPGSPAIAPNGTAYVSGINGHVYAYNGSGGLLWSTGLGAGAIGSGVALSPVTGTIYVGTGTGKLFAVAPSGRADWNATLGGKILASPALGPRGDIYVTSTDGSLYALWSNGTVRWKLSTGASITDSPSVDANGTVYVGGSNGYLYAVNPNGTLQWQDYLGAPINSSVAVGFHGRLYVTTTTGYLWEIGYDPSGAANTLRVPVLWVSSVGTTTAGLTFTTVGAACRTTYEVEESASSQGPWTRYGYGTANYTVGTASLTGFSTGTTLWFRLSTHPCGFSGVLTSNPVVVTFGAPVLHWAVGIPGGLPSLSRSWP